MIATNDKEDTYLFTVDLYVIVIEFPGVFLSHLTMLAYKRLILGHLVAAFTLFAWDYVLSLLDEVKIIWGRRRWNVARVCYVGLRYPSIAGLAYGAYGTSLDRSLFYERD